MRWIVLLLLLTSCATATVDPQAQVDAMLDGWHDAAADADESRYFAAMAPEFIFLGTDATERWDIPSFRAFAHPYFEKGQGWTYVPRDRHVIFSPRGDVAWFDEKLDNASYGECRGTGVARRVNGAWKLAHYNLMIPIPNELSKAVVGLIRGGT